MKEDKTENLNKNDKLLGDLELASETINDTPVKIVRPKAESTENPIAQTSKSGDYKLFKTFVNGGKLAIRRPNGSLYLKSEAWLFLAHLKGVTPSVEVVPVYSSDDDTRVLRVTAICKLYDKDGIKVSQSTMVADHNEEFLKNLDNYAVFGMAETRAVSRAIRNVYGYIAAGAGYESTPADEVGLERASRE